MAANSLQWYSTLRVEYNPQIDKGGSGLPVPSVPEELGR